METIVLNNGAKCPVIGIGSQAANAKASVQKWLSANGLL